MKRPWRTSLAALAFALPLQGGAIPSSATGASGSTTAPIVPMQVPRATDLDRFTFDLSNHANRGPLLGVNGFWQDPTEAPSGAGATDFLESIGPGNERPMAKPAIGAAASPSTVDEPLVPVFVAIGALAFVFEQRRMRAGPGDSHGPAIPTTPGPSS